MTITAFRALVRSLPEAEEKAHMGHPDFRVRNKIFATLWPAEGRAVVKLDRDHQAALVAAAPATFARSWGNTGWTSVELAGVDEGEMRELVIESWRAVAPKRLVAEFDAG